MTPRQKEGLLVVFAAAALVVSGLVLARLADVVLMAFGAVLVAILLHALAQPIRRLTRMESTTASLLLAVLAIAIGAAAVLWLFGSQAASQLEGLSALLPGAWARLHRQIGENPLGRLVLDSLGDARPQASWLIGVGQKALQSASTFVAGSVIVFFAGLYLAFHPQSYLNGVLSLAPWRFRERLTLLLGACHEALRQWLIGQVISMVLVGGTVAAGLGLSGAPSPVALGVIAALGQFIPVIGPIAAAVPGLIAAAGAGGPTLFWSAATYLVASQFEANVVTPLVLRRMVQLPMAVTLFAVLASGVLLGPLGVLMATPLAVVAHVVVKQTLIARFERSAAAA